MSIFADYYNRTVDGDNVEMVEFRAGKGLQSAELNEVQSLLRRRLDSVATATFSNGDIIKGAAASMISDATLPDNTFIVTDGTIFFSGAVYAVAGTSLPIPLDAIVFVGIRVNLYEIDEQSDVSLLDPASGTPMYQMPGAGRQKIQYAWGWQSDDNRQDGHSTWTFYPIFKVDHGNLIINPPPSGLDQFTALLAKYDREAHGNYIDNGLQLQYITDDGTNYVYDLSAGEANIFGFKINRLAAQRLIFAKDPDTRTVSNEPHTFQPDANSKFQLFTNRSPIATVSSIIGQFTKTVSITHGGFAGAVDELPDSAIVSITNVHQSSTVYTAPTDYLLSGDSLDWSPGGGEPAPSSTYSVTYIYQKNVDPTTVPIYVNYIELTGMVTGGLVQVSYTYKLARVDLLVIGSDSNAAKINGVSQLKNPLPPDATQDQIGIATITYDWRNAPVVVNSGIRAIPFSDITAMRVNIFDLYDLVAQLMLLNKIAISDPSTKLGVFVDPFLDDDQRDAGRTQNATVAFQLLQLPILTQLVHLGDNATNEKTVQMLSFTLEAVVTQTVKTGCQKINPFQAFAVVPAQARLNPAIDNWTDKETVYAAPITINGGQYYGGETLNGQISRISLTQTSTATQKLSTAAIAEEFIRQIPVAFTVDGFGNGETLSHVTFDGIDVTPGGTITANSSGHLAGTFNIPANVVAGNKQVAFTGSGGGTASTIYIAGGTLDVTTLRRVTVVITEKFDPLAETFTLIEDRMIAAIDIKFCALGSTLAPVFVQIRETDNGYPSSNTLAEAVMPVGAILTNGGFTRFTFPIPPLCKGGVEYAFVILTNDPNHSVAIAQLGQFFGPSDNAGQQGYVTSNAYPNGVMFVSSNASAWTAVQDTDLCFQIQCCLFTGTTKTVALGNVSVAGVSDVEFLALCERDTAITDVEFIATFPGSGTVLNGQENQDFPLADFYTDTVAFQATLIGDTHVSPVLFPPAQLLTGIMSGTGNYISRAIPTVGVSFTSTVTFEQLTPGASTVTPSIEVAQTTGSGMSIADVVDGGGNYLSSYSNMTLVSRTPVGNGWYEVSYTFTGGRGVGLDRNTRIQLILSGTPLNRPLVRQLRGLFK